MKFSLVSLFTAAAAFASVHAASNVLELVPETFHDTIGKGKPALVEFFAPWCGHCKNLAPVYEQLADAFSHAKDKVIIAKVDADGEGRPLGQEFGVTGFPTLKWFAADGTVTPYEGQRDLDALAGYVSENAGVKSSIKPPPPPAYTILTAKDFDSVALDPTKDVLVAFTAPWCGHCNRMKPDYEKVALDFATESSCVVANVDADAAQNAELKTRYGVSGFPTIKFFGKDSKEEPETYDLGRSEADFVSFLNEKCGTHRTVGGDLNEFAGRLPEFDALASKFFGAAADARSAVYDEAVVLAAEAGDAAQRYLKIMQKVVNGSEYYISKESNRLASILKKRTLAPHKLDELKIKANVLAAFAAEKAEEVSDEVKEEVEHLKEEL